MPPIIDESASSQAAVVFPIMPWIRVDVTEIPAKIVAAKGRLGHGHSIRRARRSERVRDR